MYNDQTRYLEFELPRAATQELSETKFKSLQTTLENGVRLLQDGYSIEAREECFLYFVRKPLPEFNKDTGDWCHGHIVDLTQAEDKICTCKAFAELLDCKHFHAVCLLLRHYEKMMFVSYPDHIEILLRQFEASREIWRSRFPVPPPKVAKVAKTAKAPTPAPATDTPPKTGFAAYCAEKGIDPALAMGKKARASTTRQADFAN